MTSRGQTYSIRLGVRSIDCEIGRYSNSKWHRLLVDSVVTGVFLDDSGDVVNRRLHRIRKSDS
jgi:hypothetical protein